MISLLAGLFGGRTWAAWLVVAVLATGGYAWIDHQGYARASAAWEKKYDAREAELQAARFKEIDRQATANAEAKAREAARLAAEQARADALERVVEELTAAAEADPNASRVGLGADSVDRLNRIR